MQILSRYFAKRFVGLYALILLVSTATIIVIEMLLNLDDMLAVEHGPGGPIQYLLLRFPTYYLRELVPITAFAASFSTFAISAHWLEISAAHAGGISPRRILVPIIGAASLLGLAGFVIGETWIVNSTRDWNRREAEDSSSVTYREGSFWYHRGRTIYNITSADPSLRILHGVHLYDLDSRGQLIRKIDSRKVEVEDARHWRFHDATIRRFDPQHPDRGASVEYLESITLEVANREDIALINADPKSLNLIGLLDYIAIREAAGEDLHRVKTILYSRISDPIVAVLFAMLAAPLGLQVRERRSVGIPAMWSIGIVAGYFALRSISMTLSTEGVIPAGAGAFLLIAVFGVLSLLRLRTIRS